MRSTPEIPEREELAAYVENCATRVDGRLGVLLGRPTGPTFDDFDVLVAHGTDREYASASVIKLPILYTLYREYDGNLDALDDPCGITPENSVSGSGLFHLLDTPTPSLRDLARAMIAVSDNAATNELIDHVGMKTVVETAATLGMERTHLGRKMMVTLTEDDGDAADSPINTTSPRDCARLFSALLHGDALEEQTREEQLQLLYDQKDRSMFPRYFPYEVQLAHKTGWLPDAALDTGLVVSDGFRDPPLFFAVFCDRCVHGGDAMDSIATIGDATLAWARDHSE